MTLGQAIRLIRTVAGKTAREFALSLGITAVYLSLLERDHANPSRHLLDEIAHLYGYDPRILWCLSVGEVELTRHAKLLQMGPVAADGRKTNGRKMVA